MLSNPCAQLANQRFPRMGLLKAASLSLLLTVAWTQGLLPCHPATQTRTVVNTDDTAALASLLRCSNGSFVVQWFGDVAVSQTLYVTQGTSLNITGATAGATADGNHTTQLFSVDGASSLHMTNMVVTNGAAEFGGAILALDKASISFGGSMTFAANTARYGGAIHAGQSTSVFWDGEDTTFLDNHAIDGGAVMVKGSSDISWDGLTVFLNNSADYAGGAICLTQSSEMSWSNITTFVGNTAWLGGAVCAESSNIVWDGTETTSSNNHAIYNGGGLVGRYSSSFSWYGGTVFSNNSAGYQGGAIFTDFSYVMWDDKETIFSGNYASGDGGAIMAENSSTVSWDGETLFVNNIVGERGGGACILSDSNVLWTGNTTFQNNYANSGAGLGIFGHSVGAWSGSTTFASNTAAGFGGGLDVDTHSNVSWAGTTTFVSNVAGSAGAMVVSKSNISWTGNTVFADNIAHTDAGAVYVCLDSNLVCQGTTTFRNNSATTRNGGALGIYGCVSGEGPTISISGETTFTNNSAFADGGGIFSSENPWGQYYEGVLFRYNSARTGGAVATFGTGNGNGLTEAPTKFWRCQFTSNTAIESGGAVETASGREEFVSTHFDSNYADVGGALHVGGITTIVECSFVSNTALNAGLAVAATGSLEISDSSFDGNSFFCDEGKYVEVTRKDPSNTARYDSVCRGCPPWNECPSCTVRDSNLDPTCLIALEHTSAAERGTTLETLSVDSGYWRATNRSSTILACYHTGSCVGGKTGEDSFCDDGYTGPYCSLCRSGYFSTLSSTCTRCSPLRRRWSVAAAVVVGTVTVCAMVAFSRYLMSNFEELDRASIWHIILRKAPLQALKSVIVVWQILTQFASVANVTYPGVYQAFLSSVDIINLDIGYVMSARCLWTGIDFHDRVVANTILPLTILGMMGTTYVIALRRNALAGDGALEKIRNKHLSAVLLLLFLVYSSVSSTVFQMFACDSLDDGEEYLRADYRIICTGAKHRALQVYAAIMIAVYPVGIPLLFAVLLYRHRDILSDSGAEKSKAQSISSLWAPYRPSCFYYEVVECGRRIMLTGVVVFIFPNDTAQIAITIINTFFFFVVSEALSPYKSASDTWLSRFGHVLVFFTMFDILLLKVDASQESSESQHILAGVLVAGHAVMIVAVVAEAVGLCYASRSSIGPARQ